MRVSGRAVLGRAVSGEWRDVVTGAVLGAGHQAGEAMVPVLIGVVVDRAVARGSLTALLGWLVVLAAVYVGLSFSFRFGARAGERAAEQAGHRLRMDLVRRVLHPAGGAENGRLPGALATLATEDARRVGAVNTGLVFGISALMGLVVAAAVLLRTSLPLGLVVLLGTPAMTALGHLLSKPLEQRSETEQERAADASGVAADLVAGLRVLKGLGAVPAAVERYRRTSRDSLAATLRATRAQALQNGLVLALTGVFIAVIALVGGRLAAEGSISLGQLVSAVGLAMFLLGPLETLTWVNADLAQGRASARRIAEVLSAAPEITTAQPLPPATPVRGGLRLRGVGHGSLRGLDLDIAPGELLGVAVADPADATALIQCLARRQDPGTGAVELDGIPLTALDPAELRSLVLVAEHDADLFAGTLHDNVAAAADPSTDLAPITAAAGADEVAAALAQGYHTPVSERGRSLSGGQRQRMALARALAADREVLVLHDPTTAVDAVTEAAIADGLRTLRHGRTTVLITTSPALLAVADRVVLIEHGRVADTGPHLELIQRQSGYCAAVLA
ncbi:MULTISPECIES: ABC transporter ATP-binding protein [Streptacidiphilus]|uniref:ABC transporter ATP-binding protein n=1 Tax=Streptacidiphilus cavernicola TaxID=3342716 RepID=A0ABV6UQ49_9ACTN|nr:ABC transporter ATP-binding protein [Streptacidiphilus jeojiense]